MPIGFNIRPYARECLREVNKHYEVCVFTASIKAYADVIIDYLDPEGDLVQHRLYRDSCILHPEKVYMKDLRIFSNRNLDKIVLVDNAVYSFMNQLNNGIPIVSYRNNEHDDQLKHLTSFLTTIAASERSITSQIRDVF